ncbi:U3 small nucleolar RNA-associated protein 11 [Caligus rogercresseyi]|uniref:U3 small nucleolar RNA-associated protein 11 n=1 Tax=Caligus rogercresseyi TaxID=217165 RepID=A0A7T8KH89_CALRO|nr:U3 small nucleolar RNA-associated protein 11 [Caligus rogercresseyi]
MSSLKKASKLQKTHRERHQPEGRKAFGLLEKKKDYKLRANEYNAKKAILQKLRQKALDKNPDEFYHHMINSAVVNDMHQEKFKGEESEFTPEQIAVMQSQDIKYIIHRRNVEKKKVERLKASLHLISAGPIAKNKHTFFVDEDSEKGNSIRSFNRPTTSTLESCSIPVPTKSSDLLKEKRYKELETRLAREKQLAVLEEKMRSKILLQNKGNKPVRMVAPGTKDSAPIYRWAQERKK